MKKSLFVISLITFSVMAAAGCVDINDARVQVQRPGEVDAYARNVLDKCPPHTNPHRLVLAQTGSNSPLAQAGPQMFHSQPELDKMWGYLSSVDSGKVTTSSLSQEPVVNWDQEMVYFLVVAIDNSCQKTKPYGDEMNTDCYSITVPLYRYLEGTNCQTPGYYPVFIYIFPKTAWPVNILWVYPTPTPSPTPVFTPTATPTMTPRPVKSRRPTPTPQSEDE